VNKDKDKDKDGFYSLVENCDYQCPKWSTKKPNRKCYDTFNDYQCDKGYYRYKNRCVPDEKYLWCSEIVFHETGCCKEDDTNAIIHLPIIILIFF
jgi:hypothetical protein